MKWPLLWCGHIPHLLESAKSSLRKGYFRGVILKHPGSQQVSSWGLFHQIILAKPFPLLPPSSPGVFYFGIFQSRLWSRQPAGTPLAAVNQRLVGLDYPLASLCLLDPTRSHLWVHGPGYWLPLKEHMNIIGFSTVDWNILNFAAQS